jgi:hypothetical protein
MPTVKTTVSHNLEKEEVKSRLENHSDTLQKHWAAQVQDLERSWVSDDKMEVAFKAFGFPIKGDVTVEPSDVVVKVELPFAAIMLRGAIEEQIVKDLKELLV